MNDRINHRLELDDIPRFVTSGFKRLRFASYFLVRITDTVAARAFIARHAGHVLPASSPRPSDNAILMAFSHPGLYKLTGASGSHFDDAFREGMCPPASERRARLLGDTGDNHSRHWAWGSENEIDMVTVLFQATDNQLPVEETRDELAQCGHVDLVSGEIPPDKREPFGFVDGISQPHVEGLDAGPGSVHDPLIKPGEFILGYENEAQVFSEVPALGGNSDWGRNGSYFVLRQLRQDVDGFNHAMARFDDPAAAAARIVGRWQDGAPLTLNPKDSPGPSTENEFSYFAHDQHGFSCPLGAHVRRSNPRDALTDETHGVGIEHARARNRQHRMIRRGRVYRTNSDVGLMFGALVASIEDQFEFVQHMYVGGSGFAGLVDEDDALTGTLGSFTRQHPYTPSRTNGLKQFVFTRGGGYFFLPGLRGLAALGSPRG